MEAIYPVLSQEERESIINEAVQRTLLSLPEVIGNLLRNHATMMKLNKKFYDENPELKDHKDLVAAVMEQVDGTTPSLSHEELQKKALPEIKARLRDLKKLNTTTVKSTTPDLGVI